MIAVLARDLRIGDVLDDGRTVLQVDKTSRGRVTIHVEHMLARVASRVYSDDLKTFQVASRFDFGGDEYGAGETHLLA